MTRFLVRTDSEPQFQRAKDLLAAGRARLFVVSERYLFLSAADLPESLQEELRATGARVTIERPAFSPC